MDFPHIEKGLSFEVFTFVILNIINESELLVSNSGTMY